LNLLIDRIRGCTFAQMRPGGCAERVGRGRIKLSRSAGFPACRIAGFFTCDRSNRKRRPHVHSGA